MPSDLVLQEVAVSYLWELYACLVVWVDVMDILWRDDAGPTQEEITAALGPLARIHRSLAQRSVTPATAAVQHAALSLLQSAMDAMDAIAVGRGKPEVREMQEQLTIFQTELVLFAQRAGLVP
jgi:hypothetical protein